jgi:hypothetical protein
MRRVCIIVFLFCVFVPFSEAQLWKMKRYELAGGFGPSMLFGDIGGFSKTKNILGLRDISLIQTRFNFNLNFKYRITQDINIRLSFTSGLLHASDARGSNDTRGYEAAISIFEPSILGEYYLIKNRAENSYLFSKGNSGFISGIIGSLDVYAFAGAGGLRYNVKANDKLIARQVLDGIQPASFTMVIPAGAGASLAYSPNFSFGVELGARYTFTDLLDGFTSPTSSSNDLYDFFNFTIIYKLKTTPKGFPSFR